MEREEGGWWPIVGGMEFDEKPPLSNICGFVYVYVKGWHTRQQIECRGVKEWVDWLFLVHVYSCCWLQFDLSCYCSFGIFVAPSHPFLRLRKFWVQTWPINCCLVYKCSLEGNRLNLLRVWWRSLRIKKVNWPASSPSISSTLSRSLYVPPHLIFIDRPLKGLKYPSDLYWLW